MTKVIVMTDAMTVSEIDGHRLAVMATTQRHRTDVAAGNRITPKVLVDQDADSPGETKTEVTHDLGIEIHSGNKEKRKKAYNCLLYTSPSPRDRTRSRMPSSA